MTVDKNKRITTLLQKFNLEAKQIQVYLALNQQPWQTVVQLADATHIPRPTLYRLLNELISKGLVEHTLDYKTTYYSTTPVKALKNLVLEQQHKARQLEATFSQLAPLLSLPKTPQLKTTVSFYRGLHSLKSMEWEMLEEQGRTLFVFGCEKWWQYLSQDFAEKIRAERVKRQLYIREILNTDKRPRIGAKQWTNVAGYLDLYSVRYIDRDVLPIDNEMMMTAHSVYIYSLNESELVGIKLHSPAYAQTMKHLFEVVWKLAKV